MFSLIVCAIAFGVRQGANRTIDGTQLVGFEAAVKYLQVMSRHDRQKFVLPNYNVVFEGGYRYHFLPKAARGERVTTGWSTSLGATVRITVDPKTNKVVSAVVE